MTKRPRDRLARPGAEGGFTLIELLIVIVILAILASVAVVSFRSITDRARSAAAQSLVRQIVPSIEAYYADYGTYGGMTLAGLRADYDQAIDPASYSLGATAADTYCVQATRGGQTWRKNGPTQPAEELACT